jgi:hypothetical protein
VDEGGLVLLGEELEVVEPVGEAVFEGERLRG